MSIQTKTSPSPRRRPATVTSDWRDRAACVTRPADWWDDDAAPDLQRKARATCLSCPVFAQCLKDATRSEAGYDYGRSHTKAGLTGRQRDWLYRASRKHGPYDAEEARLLALEAKVSVRSVEKVAAREGVEGTTVLLARRLLAEDGGRRGVQGARTAAEQIQDRMAEVLAWRDEGLTLETIAARLEVTRRKLSQVMREYLDDDSATSRKRVTLTDDDIEAMAARRRRGVTWLEMDAEDGLAPGTTYQRMGRWRRDADKRGVPVPKELAREAAKLTEAAVVRMRERAQEGVEDAEQALEAGLSRVQVTRIVTGENYRMYGGPLRPKKQQQKVAVQPCEASRVLFNGGMAGFAKAS